MNSLKEFLEPGQTILRVETQNTVAFLRPIPDICMLGFPYGEVWVWAPCPTAGLAESLRLCQIRFAFAEFLFRSFARVLGALALGYIDHGAYELIEIAGWVEGRMTNNMNVP